VVLAAARMRHDVMLVFCIPPVFVAIIMGFSMGIYAWDTFGTIPALMCPVVAWFAARELDRRYAERDFLIAIYLVWAVGLAFAMIAVEFPDIG
jgi:positive regulator of sigma E activity